MKIHADPDPILGDANNDGRIHSDDDEFLEFVNIGEIDLDLSGWTVSDLLKPRYIFPDGTILKMGCAAVVFGGGDPLKVPLGQPGFQRGQPGFE